MTPVKMQAGKALLRRVVASVKRTVFGGALRSARPSTVVVTQAQVQAQAQVEEQVVAPVEMTPAQVETPAVAAEETTYKPIQVEQPQQIVLEDLPSVESMSPLQREIVAMVDKRNARIAAKLQQPQVKPVIVAAAPVVVADVVVVVDESIIEETATEDAIEIPNDDEFEISAIHDVQEVETTEQAEPAQTHIHSVVMTIAIGVLSRRAAVAEHLNTTGGDASMMMDESAIDLGDMAALAAPKRTIKPHFASQDNASKIPMMNCDIASYALQKSSLVDAARARLGLQREASTSSLSSASTNVAANTESVEVSEDEWN